MHGAGRENYRARLRNAGCGVVFSVSRKRSDDDMFNRDQMTRMRRATHFAARPFSSARFVGAHSVSASFVSALFVGTLFLSTLSSPAAAFELQRLDGVRTNLNDHVGDGKWTLVMLWTTDCVPCEQQKPMIGEFHDAHVDHDARVVGMALDGPDALPEILALVEHHDANYPTLVAFDDVFGAQFAELAGKNFRATPTYLLYAPDGRYVGTHTGPVERAKLEGIVATSH